MDFTSKLLTKKAYGYDPMGEVGEMSNGPDQQKRLDDTAEPQDGHMTQPNPANIMMDSQALEEYPELLQKKQRPNIFPHRVR